MYYLKNFISGTRSQKRRNLSKIKTKKYGDLCFFFQEIPILFCGTMLGDIIPFIFGLDPPKVAFVGDISPFMGKSGIYKKKKFHFEKKNISF